MSNNLNAETLAYATHVAALEAYCPNLRWVAREHDDNWNYHLPGPCDCDWGKVPRSPVLRVECTGWSEVNRDKKSRVPFTNHPCDKDCQNCGGRTWTPSQDLAVWLLDTLDHYRVEFVRWSVVIRGPRLDSKPIGINNIESLLQGLVSVRYKAVMLEQ